MSDAKDSALYAIDRIKLEVEHENYLGCVRMTEYLYTLIKFAAIAQERNNPLPTLYMPDD